MNWAIRVEDLTVVYQKTRAIWDIDVEIPKGSYNAIIGPNGAGKTTFLRSLLGFIKPLSGRIWIEGKPYQEGKKYLSYVPQMSQVDWDFPISVFEVVLMGFYKPKLFYRPSKEEKEKALSLLDKVGILDLKDRRIKELSGGQRQRVFLARALARDVPIYLLDEPFQGIDAPTERLLLEIFDELYQKGKTLLVVLHDLSQVEYFSHVLMINQKIIAYGEREEVFTEENLEKTYGVKKVWSF